MLAGLPVPNNGVVSRYLDLAEDVLAPNVPHVLLWRRDGTV